MTLSELIREVRRRLAEQLQPKTSLTAAPPGTPTTIPAVTVDPFDLAVLRVKVQIEESLKRPNLAFIAVNIANLTGVETVRLFCGADWYQVQRDGVQPDDPLAGSLVMLELAPHRWWQRLGHADVYDVLLRWQAAGLFGAPAQPPASAEEDGFPVTVPGIH